ncbi:hypothetical protein EMIT0194P_160047 [Pseudomonas serbica]
MSFYGGYFTRKRRGLAARTNRFTRPAAVCFSVVLPRAPHCGRQVTTWGISTRLLCTHMAGAGPPIRQYFNPISYLHEASENWHAMCFFGYMDNWIQKYKRSTDEICPCLHRAPARDR